MCCDLEGEQRIIGAFDFGFGLQKFLTPWLSSTLGALLNCVADSKAVIASSFRAGAWKLFARLAPLEELAFKRPMLAP
jgi:hypothetical protein